MLCFSTSIGNYLFPPLVLDAKTVVVLKFCRPLAGVALRAHATSPKAFWKPPSDAVFRPPMARIPEHAQLLRASPFTVNEGLSRVEGDKVWGDDLSFFTWEYAWAIPRTEEVHYEL